MRGKEESGKEKEEISFLKLPRMGQYLFFK